jgi:serine/threonine protein kinase
VTDRIGQAFGNYRLVALLGQGGYAEVYLGQHVRLELQAAIKILHAHLTSSEAEQFYQEAQTIAKLTHPSIVRVFDFDVQDGVPFLVMDYAPNGSLRQHYPHGSLVSFPVIVSAAKQVAAALQYAHERKFIHRDVKPENILLGRQQEVLLSDFGIATIAHTTSSLSAQGTSGTLAYMAPEQIEGHPRAASDQYALAVVVYEWLCGSRPFKGSVSEMLVQHLSMPPPPLRERVPTVPAEVEHVTLRALAKDPKARFASVQDFATALERAGRPDNPPEGVTQLSALPSSPFSLPQVEVTPPLHLQYNPVLSKPPVARQYGELPPSREAWFSSSDRTEIESVMWQPRGKIAAIERKNEKVNIWRIGKSEIVSIALGSILYASLGQFEPYLLFPSVTSFSFPIFPAIVIPLFFGIISGPWVGIFTAVVGYLIEHYISGDPFVWEANLGLAVMGFVAGLTILRTRRRYNHIRTIVIAELISAVGLVVGMICNACAYILFLKDTVEGALKLFIPLALSDLILCLILLPPLLVAYNIVNELIRSA